MKLPTQVIFFMHRILMLDVTRDSLIDNNNIRSKMVQLRKDHKGGDNDFRCEHCTRYFLLTRKVDNG